MEILTTLQQLNRAQRKSKPLLLKIAPDLTTEQIDDILEIVEVTRLDGLIATNTTIGRTNLNSPKEEVKACGNGGLSGKPIKERSTEVIRYIHNKTGGKLPIIASGGVFTAEDAREKLEADVTLIQLYTGFIYEGPGIVKQICEGLEK